MRRMILCAGLALVLALPAIGWSEEAAGQAGTTKSQEESKAEPTPAVKLSPEERRELAKQALAKMKEALDSRCSEYREAAAQVRAVGVGTDKAAPFLLATRKASAEAIPAGADLFKSNAVFAEVVAEAWGELPQKATQKEPLPAPENIKYCNEFLYPLIQEKLTKIAGP